jgi:hypothetical protein
MLFWLFYTTKYAGGPPKPGPGSKTEADVSHGTVMGRIFSTRKNWVFRSDPNPTRPVECSGLDTVHSPVGTANTSAFCVCKALVTHSQGISIPLRQLQANSSPLPPSSVAGAPPLLSPSEVGGASARGSSFTRPPARAAGTNPHRRR